MISPLLNQVKFPFFTLFIPISVDFYLKWCLSYTNLDKKGSFFGDIIYNFYVLKPNTRWILCPVQEFE